MKNNLRIKIKWIHILASFLMIVAFAIFLIVIFLSLQGHTEIINNLEKDSSSHSSISCTLDNFEYPFFMYNNASSSTTVINIIFNNDEMRTISLMQKMSYEKPDQPSISEALNHAAMNKSFGNELGTDALNARYMVDDVSMNMSLFLDNNNLFSKAKKYFLIQKDLVGIEEYKTNYLDQGFNCEEN